jgi:PAS domain S-box-containing protein
MGPGIGFVVDEQLEVLEFVGHTAPLVHLPPGPATLYLPRILTESLRPLVLDALEQCRETRTAVEVSQVEYYELGLARTADLTVSPEGANRWRILLLRHRSVSPPGSEVRRAIPVEEIAAELKVTNLELRATVNELVAANQEVRRGQVALEQSQNDLRERYSFMAAVLDTVGALVLVLDPYGRIVEFNRACEAISGVTSKEACGNLVWDLIPHDQLEETKAVFAQLLAGPSSSTHENDWFARDGTRHRIAWANTTMRRSDGSVSYIIATGIEVTMRRQAELALQASEAKFRAVIENAVEAIVGVNQAGRIVIANPAAFRVFGYSQAELLESNISELIPARFCSAHVAHQQSYFEQPSARKMGFGAVLSGRRKDGSEVPLEVSLSSIETADGALAIAFVQDITERVVHRRHLQSLAGRFLKAQEEERRRIARNIHDELTQTISVLGMKLGFLKQDLDGSPEKLLAGIEDARRQVDLIHDEVRDISHRLHPTTLEYSGLVPALEGLVHEREKRTRPRVHLVVDPLPDAIPTATASALYRIAQEALHNAEKSANAENVSIHVGARDGNLNLVIIDDGQGFRLDHSRRSGGLGLISMEERARDLGGSFAVHSAPGNGTRIEVAVPFAHPFN